VAESLFRRLGVGPPAPCLGVGHGPLVRLWSRGLAGIDWDGGDVEGVATRWSCSCGRLVEVIEWAKEPMMLAKSAVPAAS